MVNIRDEISSIVLREGLKGAGDRSLKQACDDTADAILARYGVVELPTLNEPDDDGQIYTDVAELRIDTSGLNGNEVFLPGGNQTSPYRLRQEAADYLAAANVSEVRA